MDGNISFRFSIQGNSSKYKKTNKQRDIEIFYKKIEIKYKIISGIDCSERCTLDILVENLGRANFGVPHTFNQKKGI